MNLGLKSKKVILTGGSRGLGRAALELFAAEGADIAFFSRNQEQVSQTIAVLQPFGGNVFGEAFEMGNRDAYREWLSKAVARLGGLDIFVHNVSSSGAGAGSDWNVTLNLDI